MRSEGRLGYLSQCPHILGSHQIVLRYTRASHCTGNPPQVRLESGSLRGAADDEAPTKQGGCLQGAHATPASCAGLLRWGSSPPSLSHGPCPLSRPRGPLVFPIPPLVHILWDCSWGSPQPSLSPAQPITALCCPKKSWEGSKTTDTLQIKSLPEQSRQLSEALAVGID